MRVLVLYSFIAIALASSGTRATAEDAVSNSSNEAACIKNTLSQIFDSQRIGSQYLHSKNPNLHNTVEVNEAAAKFGLSESAKPTEKLSVWLHNIESSFSEAATDPIKLKKLENGYHDLFLTRSENVPESFFELQKKIAREQGHGDVNLTKAARNELVQNALTDQAQSLDQWIDYFASRDSESYPIWIKNWALNSVGKLGKFESEIAAFASRSKGTTAPFPELNREAFAEVADALVKKANGHSLSDIKDPRFLSLLESGSFSKLYGHSLKEASSHVIDRASVDGEWITYKQGTNHQPLVKSLRGMQTGWCTAGASTAEQQMGMGDFHVFYTRDKKGDYKIPRVAIRMEGDSIAEIRGVAPNQNLDPAISNSGILEKKLSEFGNEGKIYQKKSKDMQQLTLIEQNIKANQDLTREDLRFLYELDSHIEGFGYKKDPRIKQILAKRSIKADLAQGTGYKESEISVSKRDVFKKGIRLHYGSLSFPDGSLKSGAKFPAEVIGDIQITSHSSNDGYYDWLYNNKSREMNPLQSGQIQLPSHVRGSLEFIGLESVGKLKLPANLEGDLAFIGLKTTKGLILPKRLGGTLDLPVKLKLKKISE